MIKTGIVLSIFATYFSRALMKSQTQFPPNNNEVCTVKIFKREILVQTMCEKSELFISSMCMIDKD